MKLNGNFMNLIRLAMIVHPRMFQRFISNKAEFQIINFFDRVTHNTTGTLTIFYKIEFIFRMYMHGIREFGLYAIDNHEAVFLRKRRYFSEYV